AAGKVPLRGVMHAAGATSDAALATLDWERTERVMHAKVAGSWNLHMATADLALDHFVLFSSGAAFLGSPGQANHAMANNFLGALAHHRRALGKPGLSIDWGPWGEMGAATRGDVLERARAAGLDAIGTDAGLDLLGRLMSGSTTRVAAVPIDWATYLAHVPGGAGRAWFSRVRPIAAATTIEQHQESRQAPAAVEVPYLAEQLATVVAGRRLETALEGVRTIAGRVLGAGAGADID